MQQENDWGRCVAGRPIKQPNTIGFDFVDGC